MALQREAVEALADEHRRSFAWVDIATDHAVSWWQYRQPKKKEPAGVVIHFAPTGRVEVRKNLVQQEVDPKATNGKTKPKKKKRPEISKATWRYANAHKTLALQMALMGNPRKAKEATAVLLLHGCPGATINLKVHDALRELTQRPGSSNAYELIDTCARKFVDRLGLQAQEDGSAPSWARLHRAGTDWTQVISGIRSLAGPELDALIALLVILCFGTEVTEEAEPEETFFSALAKDLALDVRKVWTPDEPFLKGLTRDQLVKAATDSGALHKQARLSDSTKTELVAGLVAYFKRTADPKVSLDEYEAKGRTWLPACMQFGTPTLKAQQQKGA